MAATTPSPASLPNTPPLSGRYGGGGGGGNWPSVLEQLQPALGPPGMREQAAHQDFYGNLLVEPAAAAAAARGLPAAGAAAAAAGAPRPPPTPKRRTRTASRRASRTPARRRLLAGERSRGTWGGGGGGGPGGVGAAAGAGAAGRRAPLPAPGPAAPQHPSARGCGQLGRRARPGPSCRLRGVAARVCASDSANRPLAPAAVPSPAAPASGPSPRVARVAFGRLLHSCREEPRASGVGAVPSLCPWGPSGYKVQCRPPPTTCPRRGLYPAMPAVFKRNLFLVCPCGGWGVKCALTAYHLPPSLQSTFWRRFCPRWDVGVRGYSWKLECMTWSPPETSLVPLRFPNAKPFQLLINCDTLYGAKNVLAFVRKITKSRG